MRAMQERKWLVTMGPHRFVVAANDNMELSRRINDWCAGVGVPRGYAHAKELEDQEEAA